MSLSIIATALTALVFILCLKRKTLTGSRNFKAIGKSQEKRPLSINGLPGLLIAATLMTASWVAVSHLLAGHFIALAVPAFSGILAALQPLGSAAGVVMIGLGVLVTLALTQLINWLLFLLLGLVFPGLFTVAGPGAAFRTAWRPTLWLTAINLAVVLLPYVF